MKVTKRTIFGKKLKKLRRHDILPAVLYGNEVNISVEVPRSEFEKLFSTSGHTTITKIELDNTTYSVLIDTVQIDPVSRKPIHATLRNINLKEEINAVVPIEYLNSEICKGVKEDGGIVVENINEIEIISLPSNLPSKLEVDIMHLSLGDVIKIEDIKLPTGVRFATLDENVLSQVAVTITHKAAEEIAPEQSSEFVAAESTKEKKVDETQVVAKDTKK